MDEAEEAALNARLAAEQVFEEGAEARELAEEEAEAGEDAPA